MFPIGTKVRAREPSDFEEIRTVVSNELEYNVFDDGSWWDDEELVVVQEEPQFRPGQKVRNKLGLTGTILGSPFTVYNVVYSGIPYMYPPSDLTAVPPSPPIAKFALGQMVRPKGYSHTYPITAMKLDSGTIMYTVDGRLYSEDYLQ